MAPIAIVASVMLTGPRQAMADEGGVSFWLPGQYGSLAAAPSQPGWAFADILYLTDTRSGGQVAAARQVTIGRFSPTVNVSLDASLHPRVPANFVNANYVFATPVLGGQLAMGMTGVFGRPAVSLDGTLTASIGGFTATRNGSILDERFAFGDLYPMMSLRWNHGVHNFMVYGTGDIPVGAYDPTRLANLGIGHGAADGGVGYTYFNPATGHEFSAVTGVTYNFTNESTGYQNGIDWHLDWGASQFLTPQVLVGLVGYVYQQLTADRGQAAFLGEFKSRVLAIGPQIGIHISDGPHAGLSQPEGLRRVRRREPVCGLERLDHVFDLAGRTAGPGFQGRCPKIAGRLPEAGAFRQANRAGRYAWRKHRTLRRSDLGWFISYWTQIRRHAHGTPNRRAWRFLHSRLTEIPIQLLR